MSAEDGVLDDTLLIEAWRTAYGPSFDVVERAIRANERASRDSWAELVVKARGAVEGEVRERLREQVTALPDAAGRQGRAAGNRIWRRDVLALLGTP